MDLQDGYGCILAFVALALLGLPFWLWDQGFLGQVGAVAIVIVGAIVLTALAWAEDK